MATTRLQTAHLARLDPELERTLRRTLRERNLTWDPPFRGLFCITCLLIMRTTRTNGLGVGNTASMSATQTITGGPCQWCPELYSVFRTGRRQCFRDQASHAWNFTDFSWAAKWGCQYARYRIFYEMQEYFDQGWFSVEAIKLHLYPFTVKEKA